MAWVANGEELSGGARNNARCGMQHPAHRPRCLYVLATTYQRSGQKSAAKSTETGTKKMMSKTGHATKSAAKSTENGAKDVGHDVKEGTKKTVDAVK